MNTFTDGEKVLTFSYDVDEVIKHDKGYIVLYDYMKYDFNVDAFDLGGNKLWNINDILKKDRKDAFVGIKKSEDFENCVEAQSHWGFIYCIDIEKKEVIETLITK